MIETLKDGGQLYRAVGAPAVVRITPTLDTSAYVQNDVLFATTELPNAVFTPGGSAMWVSLRAWMKDVTALRAMRIMVLRSNTSAGAANAAEAIVDASGLEIVAEVDIAAADWVAYANFAVATKGVSDLGLPDCKPSSGTSLYTAGKYTDATGDTLAADDLVLEFRFAPGV